jgi:hypothetical protein
MKNWIGVRVPFAPSFAKILGLRSELVISLPIDHAPNPSVLLCEDMPKKALYHLFILRITRLTHPLHHKHLKVTTENQVNISDLNNLNHSYCYTAALIGAFGQVIRGAPLRKTTLHTFGSEQSTFTFWSNIRWVTVLIF